MSMMMYSLAGGILSFVIMWLAKKTNKLSMTGVSVLGGVFHNVGQILLAMWVLEMESLLYYLPVLIVSGIVAGVVIGTLGALIAKRIKKLVR
jgi:heptaprenyl diphosphate synthase